MVSLGHAAHKHPNDISVGIARVLAMEPKVLMMDEPFGSLYALTRAHLQDELPRIVGETHSTVVMVTHDVDEAMLLSDRIIMMTNGPAASISDIVRGQLERPRNSLAWPPTASMREYRTGVPLPAPATSGGISPASRSNATYLNHLQQTKCPCSSPTGAIIRKTSAHKQPSEFDTDSATPRRILD